MTEPPDSIRTTSHATYAEYAGLIVLSRIFIVLFLWIFHFQCR